MLGRLIGNERVPSTNLKNSGMNSWDMGPDSIPAICLSDDRSAICLELWNIFRLKNREWMNYIFYNQFNYIIQTSLVFSWMSMILLSQLVRWNLMKWSILGKSCSLMMAGLTRESNAPRMCLWVEPWTAAILHFPKMSSMDCG